MTDDTGYILLWALIFAGLGLMIGMAIGDEARRRKSAEEQVDELRDQLKSCHSTMPANDLKEIRSVLNDAHKRIVALAKQPRKP